MISPSNNGIQALAVINLSLYTAGLCPWLKMVRFSVSVSISSFFCIPRPVPAVINCENPVRPEEQLKASSGGATYNGNNNQNPIRNSVQNSATKIPPPRPPPPETSQSTWANWILPHSHSAIESCISHRLLFR